MRTRYWNRKLGLALVLLGLILEACSGARVTTPGTSSSHPPEQSTPVPKTIATNRVSLQIITRQPVAGIFWTADGQTIVYAEIIKDEHGTYVVQKPWHQLNTTTNEQSLVEPSVVVNPQLWTKLGTISALPEGSLWFQGIVSPSKTYVIYTRVQPGYTPPIGDHEFPPIEIRVARLDGTEAKKVGGPVGCTSLYHVVWFAQETKAIVECGYDGPPSLYLVDVEHRSIVELGDATAFKGTTGFGSFTLSPDETKLAITDLAFTLQIVPLDGSEVQAVGQWAYEPRWSPDSKRVYYQQGQRLDICHSASIHVYDLVTRKDTVVVDSPLVTSMDQRIDIACGGPFEVSPLEHSAAVWANGLWLVKWSQ